MQLVAPENYTPTEMFSPSGLSTARDCARSWAFRYIMGLKEPEVLWCDIATLGPRPEPKIKSKPTPEERKARKAWNKKYRPALGKEVHARVEQYYAHAEYPCVCLPVDWSDVPGRVALAGLCHLPAPADCAQVEVEASITIDLTFLVDAPNAPVDPIIFRGKRDLLTIAHLAAENGAAIPDFDRYLLIDHKSTYTFDYIDREHTIKTVKTPEQLEQDAQANLYALDVMQKYGLQRLACRWVYYRTEDGPAACAVDFVITREGAEQRVSAMVEQALVLRELMRKRTPPAQVKGTIESCPKYSGCIHHPEQGGRCVPPELTTGERLVQLRKKQAAAELKRASMPKKTVADIARERASKQNKPTTKASKHMGLSFRDRAKAAEAKTSPAVEVETAGVEPQSSTDDINQEAADEARAEYEADAAGVEEVAAAAAEAVAPVETPAQKTERKARAPKNAGHIVASGGLAASLSDLVAELGANEVAHADIVARIRTAVGQ